MNKLESAHEWAKLIGPETNLPLDILVDNCFDYAEDMLAEDEKRKDKSLPEALQDEFVIDWEQAPVGYLYYALDRDGKANWFKLEPYISERHEAFFLNEFDSGYLSAPSFGYQGDWKQSLRKRPE